MILDGGALPRPLVRRADAVIVGSGPAGSAVASVLARAGLDVVVVEAGPRVEPQDHPEGGFRAMASQYRAMGASLAVGRSVMPVVQGRMVGGSSPINGAICWRLPRDVYDAWIEDDPALADALPWEAVVRATDVVEKAWHVAPTDPAVAGPKNLLLGEGAEALGLAHRPIRRNVRGCEGLGRCLQGCPRGHKQSADRTFLADALRDDATLLHDTTITRIVHRRGRATGVRGRTSRGMAVRIDAPRVVVAASAVQSPLLLLASGLGQGPVGHHFQGHPGVAVAGRFAEPVRAWEGATQGHEVTGLRREGLKFEALGMGPGVLAGRLPGVGRAWADRVADLAHWADWGAAVKSRTHGRVRRVAGRTWVTWSPSPEDLRLFRRGIRVLGELMLAAGAEHVHLGVRGWDDPVDDPRVLQRFEREGPRRASAFQGAMTHLFGTCRMGSDPARSVVRPDFRLHGTDGVWVVDSSVFPTNLGVNPQVPIAALATIAGRRIVEHA